MRKRPHEQRAAAPDPEADGARLSPHEERELLLLLKRTGPGALLDRRLQARAEEGLLKANANLLRHIAKQVADEYGADPEELIGFGQEGFIKGARACPMTDADRPSAYAGESAKNATIDAWRVRLTQRKREVELAPEIEQLPPARPGCHLSRSSLGDVEKQVLHSLEHEALRRAVEVLPEADRVLLEKRYGLSMTQEQLAAEFGVSRRALQAMEKKVLSKLRVILCADS